MSIIIDYREKDIIDKFINLQIENEIKNLEVGDIHIITDNLLTIIERKREDDLCNSVNDGRYKEQKIRIKSFIEKQEIPVKVIYLIEKYNKKLEDKKYKLLNSCILSIIIKDNFNIVYSNGIENTTEILLKIKEKINDCYCNNKSNTEYYNHIKVKKINNLTPEIWYLSSLELIPKCSKNIAIEISKLFPNMELLINELKTNGINNIKNIKINNRKISSVCVNNIYSSLTNSLL